jgi:23S rRNA (guanine2445-N2)-methyltransferase / 23S rRNA (guanine2069-N7)-methyltransferase
MDSLKFLISSAPGLEELLYDEVKSMGYLLTKTPSGVFEIECSWKDAAHIAVHSRLASRFMLFIKRFKANNADVLYHKVLNIAWPKFFKVDDTFAIYSTGRSRPDMAFNYFTLKIKDAICDRFRKDSPERPSIDRQNPKIRIEAHVNGSEVSLAIDLIGYPLHRRGYREAAAEAAMKENRAAALLYFAGFGKEKYSEIVDPFCGSGTILGEAYLMDSNTAPGIVHLKPKEMLSEVPFYNDWKKALEEALENAKKEMKFGDTQLFGFEDNRKEFAKLQENMSRFRSDKIKIQNASAESIGEMKFKKPLIVANPPHGHRLLSPKEAHETIKNFVSMLKHKVAPCKLALQLSDDDLPKSVGLRPEKKLYLRAGEYKMQFLLYDIVPGEWKSKKQD